MLFSIEPTQDVLQTKKDEWTDIYLTLEELPTSEIEPNKVLKVKTDKVNKCVHLVEKLAGFTEGTSENFDGTQEMDAEGVDFLNGVCGFMSKPFKQETGYTIYNRTNSKYYDGMS